MIGMFDSGSGGLSVLKEVRKVLPNPDVLYLGDIKNAPYGSRSSEELGELTSVAIETLLSRGATRIVSACNSVSATMVLPMLSILSLKPFDMVEMVGPTVKALRNEIRPMLLLATPATVGSKIYQRGFAAVGKEIETLAVPELAGAIEFGEDNKEIEKIISRALESAKTKVNKAGVIILGCTHYPLVRSIFERVLAGTGVEIYDPAGAVAEEVSSWNEDGSGTMRFLITKDSKYFRKRVEELFGSNNIMIEVI